MENDLQEILHNEQKLESEWVHIGRRKGERKKAEPIGTGANRSRKLEAAKQTAWLYVGRLRQETTAREVVEHMIDKGIEGEIDCEQLELQKMEDPDFWPKNMIARPFVFLPQEDNRRVCYSQGDRAPTLIHDDRNTQTVPQNKGILLEESSYISTVRHEENVTGKRRNREIARESIK